MSGYGKALWYGKVIRMVKKASVYGNGMPHALLDKLSSLKGLL